MIKIKDITLTNASGRVQVIVERVGNDIYVTESDGPHVEFTLSETPPLGVRHNEEQLRNACLSIVMILGEKYEKVDEYFNLLRGMII